MSKQEQDAPRAIRGMATIRHAVENASRTPLDDAGVRAILRGEGGDPSHLRAVFGDVSLRVLEEVAAATGISPAGLFLAYQAAQHTTAAAANPELDALLAEP